MNAQSAFCFKRVDFPESVPEKTTPQRPSHHPQLYVLELLDHVFVLIFDSEGKVRLNTHTEANCYKKYNRTRRMLVFKFTVRKALGREWRL